MVSNETTTQTHSNSFGWSAERIPSIQEAAMQNVAQQRQIKDTYLKWLQQMEAVHPICLPFLACQQRKDSKRTIVFIQVEEQHLLLLMDCNSWIRSDFFILDYIKNGISDFDIGKAIVLLFV